MPKTILISGAASALGKAIIEKLHSRYSFVVISPDKSKLENLKTDFGVEFVAGTVASFSDCQRAVQKAMEKFGKIDVLINNAGLWIEGELDVNDPEAIEKVIQVNVLGPMLLTKAVIPIMKEQSSGLILNVNSQAGLYPKPERTVYNASKWAMTGFTKSLQPELEKYNIGVTSLHPGGMQTEFFDKAGFPQDSSTLLPVDEVVKVVEFLLELEPTTLVSEIGVKDLHNQRFKS